jgi:hypothetical protein
MTRHDSRKTALALLVLIAAIALAYWPSLRGDFIWDDDALVTRNALVQAPDGLYRIWFTREAVDYWPVTNTSFWLEWRVWGMNALGYRVVNVVLHTINAILIWIILRKLKIPGAFLAALLFAVHPVNVESVAWIAQRKNTLSMCLFLLSILCYVREPSRATDMRKRPGIWYVLSVLFFVLAMLAKGSVVVLPAVLLLIVWWIHRRITRRDFLMMMPYFIIGAGLTWVNIWFQTRGTQQIIRNANIMERIVAAGAIVWFYLYKALLPIQLAFVYPQWNVAPRNVLWWLPLTGLLAVSMVLFRWRNRPTGRALLFAWTFYCVALVPVLGFVDVYFMKYSLVADHYQYVAIIGVVSPIATLFSRWISPAR